LENLLGKGKDYVSKTRSTFAQYCLRNTFFIVLYMRKSKLAREKQPLFDARQLFFSKTFTLDCFAISK